MGILRGLFSAGALAVVLLAGSAWAADAPKPGAKDLVLRGDAKCTQCHDEVDNADILAIGKTRHGVRADARGPECTSCHGESNAHVTYKGSEKPPKPDRTFGKFTQTPAADREDACLACHKGGNRIQWQGSPHQSSEAVCSSCHKIHKGREQTKDKLAQAEICFACHKEQRADTHRASTHPIRAGGVGCSSCHNPHGSSGPKLLVQNTTNETCWTCHAEKRGPFLWEHPSASDDCMNCHTPHGSNNANLLKTRQPYLCSQCHIAGGHSTTAIRSGNDLGSGVITGAAASAAVQMIGKACTNCHTEVHGSNHPSGARFVR